MRVKESARQGEEKSSKSGRRVKSKKESHAWELHHESIRDGRPSAACVDEVALINHNDREGLKKKGSLVESSTGKRREGGRGLSLQLRKKTAVNGE